MSKTTIEYTEMSDSLFRHDTNIRLSQNKTDMDLQDFMESFISPLLKSIGYSCSLVDEYIYGEEAGDNKD